MDFREHELIGNAGSPVQGEGNRLAYLRYLPRRIADFERRILRYRFAGWDPNGMMVLAGDARRLADASANYGLRETREHLLALAQMVGGHASSMRGHDPKQAERMFALLSAILRSLPAMESPPPLRAAGDEQAVAVPSQTETTSAPADATPPSGEAAFPEPAAAEEMEAQMDPGTVDAPGLQPVDAASGPDGDAATGATTSTSTAVPVDAAMVENTDSPKPDVAGESWTTAAATADLYSAEPVPSPEASEPIAVVADTDAGDVAMASIDRESASDPEAAMASADPAGIAGAEADVVPAAARIHGEPIDGGPIDGGSASQTGSDIPESLATLDMDDVEDTGAVGGHGIRRIFHISDGNAFAVQLDERLELEGYAIEPVDNVDELSELLTCLMPHTLLVDASHASRWAIIGALRRDAQQQSQPPRHIQMIVMAGQDSMDMRRGAYRAGADLVLFPPFNVAGVVDRLEALHASSAAEPVRVLVVDDERADALFAQAVLNRAGMRARVEHDPMRVIEALGEERADLILMDLHMPFANGVEVTMLLRDDPQFARIPIVFLSGESDPDSRLEAINAGGDDFLFKPIRPRHLIAAVQDRVRRLHAVERPDS